MIKYLLQKLNRVMCNVSPACAEASAGRRFTFHVSQIILFILLAGIFTSSFAANPVSVSIGFRPGHNVPPDRVTDLTALSGDATGQIVISWTMPPTKGNIQVKDFFIRWSTSAVNDVPFLGDATAWWNASGGQDYEGYWANSADTITWIVNNLTPRVTYYFAIKVKDEFDNESDYDEKTYNPPQASARAAWDVTPPALITTLSALTGETEGEIALSWLSPGDDGTVGNLTGKFRIDYSTYVKSWNVNSFNVTRDTFNVTPGTELSVTVTGLTPAATYYFRIWTADDALNWSGISTGATTWAQVDVTEPASITTLSASVYNLAGGIKLEWQAPGDDGWNGTLGLVSDSVQFRVQYSTYSDIFWNKNDYNIKIDTYGVNPYDVQTITMTLSQETTYYFRIWTRDEISAGNWSEISEGATVYCRIRPSAITTLSALTGSSKGEINLFWITPGDDGTVGNLTGKFRIDYSTYVKSWNVNSFNVTRDTFNVTPGTELTRTVTGLTPAATYYFRIWTTDELSNWSDISNAASATAGERKILEPITTLIATGDNSIDGKLDLEWTSVGGVFYMIKYDVKSMDDLDGTPTSWWELAAITYPQSFQPADSGTKEAVYGLAGLTAGTTYYIAVRAVNTDGNLSLMGNVAEAVAGDKVPDVPQNLAVELVGNRIKVIWSANTEPDIDEYIIYRKTYGDFEEIARVDHPDAEFFDEDIENNNKYIYKLAVIDNTGNISDFSNEKSIIVGELVQYSDINIIRITQIGSSDMTFEWSQIEASTGQIKGYAIERTDDLTNEWIEVGFVYSTETLRYTVSIQNNVYYYRVLSVSWYGIKSKGLLALDTSEDFNHIYQSEDKDAWVEIPDSFADELYAENNDGKPVRIDFVKENNNGFLLSYNIKAVIGSSEIDNFIFKKTRMGAKIVFIYNGVNESSSQKTKSFAPVKTANQQLVLYWHNGVEWIKLGGITEGINRRIYTMSRKLGRYAIKLATLATEFTLTKVVPRIFTPEESNPTINRVSFYFENPNFAEVSISIFDITGAKIRSNLRREGENVMVWDGKDKGGSIVRGGIYLYQVEAEGKVITGTIVVAK